MIAIIIVLLAIGPFLLACLIVRGLYRKASRADQLEGQLIQSEKRADAMTEIAKHAIDEAAKAAQLKPDEVWKQDSIQDSIEALGDSLARFDKAIQKASYVPPIVTNCVKCGVSVRESKEAYPVPCPACKTLIDPVFDDPPLME